MSAWPVAQLQCPAFASRHPSNHQRAAMRALADVNFVSIVSFVVRLRVGKGLASLVHKVHPGPPHLPELFVPAAQSCFTVELGGRFEDPLEHGIDEPGGTLVIGVGAAD